MKRKRYAEIDIKELVENEGYKFIKYEMRKKNKGTKRYLFVQCLNNHEPYWVEFNSFKRGCRCTKCRLDEQRLSYEYVKEFIEKENYRLLSKDYKDNQTKLLIKCPNPNHEPYETTFAQFQQGRRCKECRDESYRFSYEFVKDHIESFGYKLLSKEYKNANIKILVRCNKKHEPYLVKFSDFQNGFRCPHCKKSKGEDRVMEILEKYNISYKHQCRFKDCKFKQQLPFDFYLPEYNCCIEYDGKQHFEMVKGWGGFDHFVDTKIRDTIKNEYCKKNNIKLIRIPYWEFDNIEKILIRELNKQE